MIRTEEVPALFTAFRNRWTDRDSRVLIMDAVVRGDWQETDAADDTLENRSPNLIQVALEDTAESASLSPTVKQMPSSGSEAAKRKAAQMERMGASYLDSSNFEIVQIESMLDLAAFGFFVWTLSFDRETGSPILEKRDPRQCYPEDGWRPGDSVRTCMFARDVYLRQLSPEWRTKVADQMSRDTSYHSTKADYQDHQVTLVEVFEEDALSVYALYVGGNNVMGSSKTYKPVLLEQLTNPYGVCPVVIGQRPTLDGEPRGQFDQVVKVMAAHIRLMSLVLDYADQAVYSDIWVKDLVGQMPYGGGAYIELGPNGSIGRVAPAVSSLTVQQELETLVNNIHLGGRWPKSRPGEIDQAIASAKFIEATAGMMNTVLRTMHLVTKSALERALRIMLKIDMKDGAEERSIAGVLRNQQFLTDRKKSDIDLKSRTVVTFGIGIGHDPAQSMVLGIQGMQTKMFSKEYVQENFPGLDDVAREQERLDVETFKDMMMAKLLQGTQDGTISSSVLVEITRGRQNGEDVMSLFEKFVVKPQEEAAASAIGSGLGGPSMQPGPGPAPGGPTPPGAPPADALLGALGGGGGPQPVESVGRLSERLPGGGFAGTQFGG